MTDKEKLDAIRAEIHRLVDVRGYDVEMANDLFAFMDSLPSEHVSEELKQAAKDYSNNLDNIYGSIGEQTRKAFKTGAKWKKEQMMSKAIEGVITFNHDGRALFGFIVPDSFCDDVIFKDMDKVKLIIIKKDKDE